MTKDEENRLRSLAANIVDLEARVRDLRKPASDKTHEELQQMRDDLYVAETALQEANHEASLIKMGMGFLLKDKP